MGEWNWPRSHDYWVTIGATAQICLVEMCRASLLVYTALPQLPEHCGCQDPPCLAEEEAGLKEGEWLALGHTVNLWRRSADIWILVPEAVKGRHMIPAPVPAGAEEVKGSDADSVLATWTDQKVCREAWAPAAFPAVLCLSVFAGLPQLARLTRRPNKIASGWFIWNQREETGFFQLCNLFREKQKW
jgi:hypothetical protein